MNFLQLQTAIKETFKDNPIVNSVFDNSNMINQKHTKYSAVAFDVQMVTEYEDNTTYNYNFYAVELMQNDGTMINEHYSMLMSVLRDGFKALEDEYGVIIEYPISYQMNSVRFADVLDCVMANVNINVPNDGDCD